MGKDNWRDQEGTDNGWGQFPRKVESPRPLSEITPAWTQEDDDDLRDQVDPLRAARAIIWALIFSLFMMGAIAVFIKAAIWLVAWVTS